MRFRRQKAVCSAGIEEALVLSGQLVHQDSKTKFDVRTAEADTLHAALLLNIKPDEIRNYISAEIKIALKECKAYLKAGYIKTAACYLKHMFTSCLSNNDTLNANKLFNSEIIGSSGDGRSKTIFIDKVLDKINVKRKPRLIFYSNVWVRGGIERVLSTLFKRLYVDYEIILISQHCEDGQESFELPDEVLHIMIGASLGKKLNFSLVELCLLLEGDIFIGNPNIIYDFLDIYGILKDLNIKSICYNHGSYFLPHSTKYLFPVIEKRFDAYKNASAVTWLTNFSCGIYSNLMSNGIWMPNPNTYKASASQPLIDKDEIVLCVGRFYDTVKRLDNSLLVFKKVLERNPNAKLCLVGGYDLNTIFPSSGKSLKQILAELHFGPKSILWEGEQNDLKKYYENCSVLMLTSDSEGFCLALTEAAVHGLPVVIRDIPGLDDVVLDKVTGFVVKDDFDEMADKICLLLSDKELRFNMGVHSQEYVRRFDAQIICERWNILFNILLNENDQERINNKLKSDFHIEHGTSLQWKQIISAYEKSIFNIVNTYETERAYFAEARFFRLMNYYKSNGLLKTGMRIANKLVNKCIPRE